MAIRSHRMPTMCAFWSPGSSVIGSSYAHVPAVAAAAAAAAADALQTAGDYARSADLRQFDVDDGCATLACRPNSITPVTHCFYFGKDSTNRESSRRSGNST